jgi:hypothetical protein
VNQYNSLSLTSLCAIVKLDKIDTVRQVCQPGLSASAKRKLADESAGGIVNRDGCWP